MPYGLVGMPRFGYDQMIREYRIWIDEYVIFLSLTAFKLQHDLLCRTVFTAQEARSLCKVLLIKLCGR